ncbi:3-hydroxyacyl-CoA dehydrogenase family protein [Paraburkholderia xenovorans]|uniref:3-hydroxyacyl-CoA dehydrogenase family protein n=1 Tax=Paraburkholderia xenovorans TaxID=36873 RepID=UPI0038BB7F94
MQEKVAVVGAGTMGAAIAGVFASRGYKVAVYSRSERTLDEARVTVERLAGEDVLVDYTGSLEQCVSGASIVSENVAEDVHVKQQIFRDVEDVVSADCLLTTNTSSVPITAIAEGLRHPERVVGLHWFNPAAIMPLVEIVRGEFTTDETVRRTRAVCVRIGKEAIEVNQDIAGFVVNRLQYAMLREALYLVEKGVASVEDVDRAVETTLAPRWSASGPLQLMDLAGLDVVEKVSGILMQSLSRDTGTSAIVRQLCDEQAFGIKSGRGFYQWTADSIASTLRRRDETVQILQKHSASKTAR